MYWGQFYLWSPYIRTCGKNCPNTPTQVMSKYNLISMQFLCPGFQPTTTVNDQRCNMRCSFSRIHPSQQTPSISNRVCQSGKHQGMVLLQDSQYGFKDGEGTWPLLIYVEKNTTHLEKFKKGLKNPLQIYYHPNQEGKTSLRITVLHQFS